MSLVQGIYKRTRVTSVDCSEISKLKEFMAPFVLISYCHLQ